MFIRVKDKTERIINLNAVSSIAILEEDHRVIFNMSYACAVSSMGVRKRGVELADCIYWDDYTDEELAAILSSQFIKDNFLVFSGCLRLPNKNHIASIKIEESRQRIIVNLDCSIRLHEGADLSSDFIYIDAKTPEQFEHYKNVAYSLINQYNV